MKIWLIIITVTILNNGLHLEAQTNPQSSVNKGLSPIENASLSIQSKTYAVVVGISDYQDPDIPDLRFADRDAIAFADFLRSSAGGTLDANHMKVLINQEATSAQFAIALDWLWEVVKENDKVFIYFSGHGDVEKKSLTQPGYLLCWDAPAKVYMAGGAINVRDLKEVVSTLSVQNKAKVVLITDACRSGKLSGSAVDGAQATTANLSQQFANEIKILSCQPDEYSIEGEQWGGGRGVFSYHLIDGLYGLSDSNKDNEVSLLEISRYLEDHVSKEAAPQIQIPMIIGSRSEKLSSVDPELLEKFRNSKRNQEMVFGYVDSRNMETDLFSKIDTSIQMLYNSYKKSIQNKHFLMPPGDCADVYYNQLMNENQLKSFHSTLQRNYAAALQDEAQQVLNTMLKSGLTKDVLADKKYINSYKKYPDYLERSSELLGENHYMYPILQARKYFFLGMNASSNAEKQSHFFKALELQAEMPHAYLKLISAYYANQMDSAEYYANKAMEAVSNWVLPYCELAIAYLVKTKNISRAEELFNKAGEIDTASVLVWYYKGKLFLSQQKYSQALPWLEKALNNYKGEFCFPCLHLDLGTVYYRTNQLDKAFFHTQKALEYDSTNYKYLATMANLCGSAGKDEEAIKYYKMALNIEPNVPLIYYNIGVVYRENKEYVNALEYFTKATQMDSMDYRYISGIGEVYMEMNKAEAALPYFIKSIKLNSKSGISHWDIGRAFFALNNLEEAKRSFETAILLDPAYVYSYYDLAKLYSHSQQFEEAFDNLDQAISKGLNNYEFLMGDSELSILKNQTVQWNALMKKYFPEQFKN